MNSLRLLGEESRLVIADRRRRALGEPVPNNYEVEGIRADGTRFPLYLYLSKTTFGGDPATLAFLVDFSEVKEHQAVREELQAQFHAPEDGVVETPGRRRGARLRPVRDPGHDRVGHGRGRPDNAAARRLAGHRGRRAAVGSLTQRLLAFAQKPARSRF